MSENVPNIILVGNPNSGKSTLFNRITGYNQKISNLPGTTVEIFEGRSRINGNLYNIIDVPGVYSLFTSGKDEKIVPETLLRHLALNDVQALICVMNTLHLGRNLLLYSQLAELQLPMLVVLTMQDTAEKQGKFINVHALENALGVPVIKVNPRSDQNMDLVKNAVNLAKVPVKIVDTPCFSERLENYIQGEKVPELALETLQRYKFVEPIVKQTLIQRNAKSEFTRKIDKIVLHKFWGIPVLILVLLTIFQGVFTLADLPMSWMENGFAALSKFVNEQLPDNFITNLLANGLIPGLGGILVFIPQIALLFLFLGLLEDSGYLTRVSFLCDSFLRKLGVNGRSMIPIMGGFACAIPSIMACRSIKNPKERLISMFIIPLMSCSARLPVYVLLVGIIVPNNDKLIGIIGLQSAIMTAAYIAGIIVAILVAKILSKWIKNSEESEFLLELPTYQIPRITNLFSGIFLKCKTFVVEAGKTIIFISILLWFLSSYGPKEKMANAANMAKNKAKHEKLSEHETELLILSYKLENSYAGIIGKSIEPIIQPLGFDWRTGIAIISSFAAREVFVGTMNTLFRVGSDDESGKNRIKDRMQKVINPNTGKPQYGVKYAICLLVFFAFALQCISTLAVMRRETGGWKWPMIQLFLFTSIAYFLTLIINLAF